MEEQKVKMIERVLAIIVEHGKLSIGRVMTMTMFILMVIQWARGQDVPSTMVTVFLVMLGYVMGSKVFTSVSDTVSKISDTRKTVAEAVKK